MSKLKLLDKIHSVVRKALKDAEPFLKEGFEYLAENAQASYNPKTGDITVSLKAVKKEF